MTYRSPQVSYHRDTEKTRRFNRRGHRARRVDADRFGGRPALRAGMRGRIGCKHEPRPIPTWLAFASDSDRARRVATPPNRGALYDKRLESCFLDNISCGQQSEISLAEFEGCTDDGFAGAGDAIAMGSRHL